MKDMIFKVDNKEYQIVKTAKKDNKDFIIYKDNNNELYASTYSIVSNDLVLDHIENEDDWDFVDSIMEDFNV